MERIKTKATEAYSTTKRVVLNAEQFAQAVALLIVSGKTVQILQTVDGQVERYVLSAAVAVVGLRAFVELIKFLDKKG